MGVSICHSLRGTVHLNLYTIKCKKKKKTMKLTSSRETTTQHVTGSYLTRVSPLQIAEEKTSRRESKLIGSHKRNKNV